ncbi:alpha/beta hydrolase family protein [Agromyces soli]
MSRGARVAKGLAIGAGAVAFLAVAVATATAAIGLRFAKKVVTPPVRREEDVRILAVDLALGEVLLEASDEAGMEGRYGFWFDRDSGYARLGDVLEQTPRTVRRLVESVDFGRLERAQRGRMSGWYHLGPWELGHAYENVAVPTPLGPAPAWYVPAEEPRGDWIVQVHGWGARRPEGLRAVGPARAAGWDTLLVSYRNDGEAPSSGDGRFGLGSTEWRDVEAAVEFAKERGARRIVLMGWSMGGGTVLQAMLRSPAVAEAVCGLVLESPAVDWADILRYQGTLYRLPREFGDVVGRLLRDPIGAGLAGLAEPIDLAELDAADRADELEVPMLVLHSVDDGFVPIDGSRRLAAARPDLVEFEVFEGARHTKLWNQDPERWKRLIADWLERRGD